MKNLLIALSFFAHFALVAQSFYHLDIAVYQEEYTQLENAENLTAGMPGWEFDWFEIDLSPPIHFPILGGLDLYLLEIETDAIVYVPGNDLYVILAAFEGYFVDPAYDSQNTDSGNVYYKFADGISTIEYRNVASYRELYDDNETLASRFNLKMEIRHADGRVRYHYGPSFISESMLASMLDDPIMAGLMIYYEDFTQELYSLVLITGDPDKPEFVFFDDEESVIEQYISGFPDSGTVYEFNFSELVNTVSTDNSNILRLFPNPATHHVTLDADGQYLPSGPLQVKLYDQAGRLLKSMPYIPDLQVDVSRLPAGKYFFRLEGGQTIAVVQWVKQ